MNKVVLSRVKFSFPVILKRWEVLGIKQEENIKEVLKSYVDHLGLGEYDFQYETNVEVPETGISPINNDDINYCIVTVFIPRKKLRVEHLNLFQDIALANEFALMGYGKFRSSSEKISKYIQQFNDIGEFEKSYNEFIKL